MITYNNPTYTRNDVNYDTWYSDFAKSLAKHYTIDELFAKLYVAQVEGNRASRSHLRAIEKTSSMTGNSQARAQTGNMVRAAGDNALAICAAIEIHKLFPEKVG